MTVVQVSLGDQVEAAGLRQQLYDSMHLTPQEAETLRTLAQRFCHLPTPHDSNEGHTS